VGNQAAVFTPLGKNMYATRVICAGDESGNESGDALDAPHALLIAPRGIIASSQGSAMVTPTPRRTVRR
jgi:uncharacterized protein (DUF2345 family)